MAALGIRLRSLLKFSLVARWFVARHCRKIYAPLIVEAQKGPYSSKARFWHLALRISLTSAQRRLHLLSSVFCGRFHEGDP